MTTKENVQTSIAMTQTVEKQDGALSVPDKSQRKRSFAGKTEKLVNLQRFKHISWHDSKADIVYGGYSPETEEKSSGKNLKDFKRIVFIDMKLKRLSEINTSTETFRCSFHYYLTWLATKEEVESGLNKSKNALWAPDWRPHIEFTNVVEIHADSIDSDGYKIREGTKPVFQDWAVTYGNANILGFDPLKAYWIRCRYDCDITFAEELELEYFPFDCQDFSMYMKSVEDCNKCDILPIPRKGDFCLLDSQFSVFSEWYLERTMIEFGSTDASKSKSFKSYPLLTIHVKASRRWLAHLGFIIVTFCMFGLGLGTFSLAVDELGNRLQYCITFLLADVATLQFISTHLPNLAYFTLLDWYMYLCFIFLFLITIWSCFTGVNDWISDHDGDAFYVFLAFDLIIQIGLLFMSIRYHKIERLKLDMTSKELEIFFKRNRVTHVDRRSIITTWGNNSLEGQDASDILTFRGEKEN